MFQSKKLHLLITLVVCMTASFASATSLFDEKEYEALYADKNAVKVGDGITILIFENVEANSSAGQGSQGDFSFSGDANVDDRNWAAGVNLGSSNNGDAATNRNGFVRAQLTAIVVEKDEYGGLIIEGNQKITVNDETQTVRVKGRVRPEDVTTDNTVASFRLQNAEISIDGDGSVSKGKNSNVFKRFAKWLGL
jgi:flagellar L-ring protein precursor FlgH